MDYRSCLLLLFIGHSVYGGLPQLYQIHSKFQYKHTFKGPHLTNSKGHIPFWEHGGSAIASDESIRVCPSVKSRRGWVWSVNPLAADHWMMDISMRITGRLKNGADGMAVWFTESKGTEGSVYGNTELWKGLGIIMDSFDNDGQHDNPRIQVVLNDGTRQYQHHTDGKNTESGGCVKDFRNRPYPVKMKVVYLRGTLEVWIHEGVSLTEDDYELCTKLEHLPELSWLPKQGYLGVSAATGGLSDDHDVLSFVTHSITPLETKAQERAQERVDETKLNDLSDQYAKMAKDFDNRRDTYQQEHNKGSVDDWQREVETEQSMRLVADMQTALHREIRAVAQKVDLLITGGAGGVDRGRPMDAVGSSLATEISHIKTTESNILHQLADLRAAMDRTVPEGGKATLSEQLQPVYETKAMVSAQAQSIESVLTELKTLAANKCPTSSETSACLTPWLFVVVVAMQLIVMLGYSIYRQAQERNAKKFF
ncbi:protein ERGIC-53-like [Halichondria panicea]|uniref:protein ERGIC-53-like n=1 Tax=Halichondria panicea TaxID=6063 RepID=UPI00312B5CA1